MERFLYEVIISAYIYFCSCVKWRWLSKISLVANLAARRFSQLLLLMSNSPTLNPNDNVLSYRNQSVVGLS